MIRILHASDEREAADRLVATLTQEFPELAILAGDEAVANHDTVAWDDALLVLHRGQPLADDLVTFVREYRQRRTTTAPDGRSRSLALIIPVALDRNHPEPPEQLATVKSAVVGAYADAWEPLLRRLRVHLGLAIRGGARVFLSYRSVDGATIAEQLEARLRERSFDPWLDVARENVVEGDEVQDEIAAALGSAGAMILIDTPEAKSSEWIRLEVKFAHENLLPILPLVFGPRSEPAFRNVDATKRGLVLMPAAFENRALTDDEIEEIAKRFEELLAAVYVRRRNLAIHARQAYEDHDWNWAELDSHRGLFEATRPASLSAQQTALNHCSFADPGHAPTVRAIAGAAGEFNQRVLLYDGEQMTLPQIRDLREDVPAAESVSVLHYSELWDTIASNFTR